MPAAVLRTAAQKAAVRAEIARRYRAGATQAVIGAELGLSQQAISYYLQQLHQEWRTSADLDITAIKAQELARIDWLEQEAQAEYARSKKPIKKHQVVSEMVDVQNGDMELTTTPGKATRTTDETTGRVGDPRFLDVMKWCIEQRLKIFGLYAVVRADTALTLTQPLIREVVVTLRHEPVAD